MGIQSSARVNVATDTGIKKQRDHLRNALDSGFYAKKFWYYWINGRDTMDYKLVVSEILEGNAVRVSIHHKKQMLFSKALELIRQATPVIKEDFNLDKLDYLFFASPLYYRDF